MTQVREHEEDRRLLALCLEQRFEERVPEATRTAFARMLDEGHPLTPKQRAWVHGVAERLGEHVAPSENLFSQLSSKRQEEQRKAAAKVRLPWEK